MFAAASLGWHELVGLMALGDGPDHSMVGVVRTRVLVEVDAEVDGPEVITVAGRGRDAMGLAWRSPREVLPAATLLR